MNSEPEVNDLKVVNLEVAYSCNMNCKFCYNPWKYSEKKEYHQQKTLPADEFYQVIDKLKKWGVEMLGFSGGEPLLNPEVFDIAAYSKKQGFKNSLLTNGVLVEDNAENIAKNFDAIQLPFLGLESTHNELTGKKDHFNTSIKARIALMEYSLPTSAVIVVNKQNLSQINDIMEIIAAMDMRSVLVNRFLPGGNGIKNIENLQLAENDLVEMLNIVEKSADDYGLSIFMGTPTPLCLEGLRSYKFLIKRGCMAGKGLHCAVDPAGNLRVCNHSPKILGNCVEGDPKDIYDNSDYVKGFMDLRYAPEMCKECDKLAECKGGCREASNVLYGSLNAPDPIFSNYNSLN